MKQWILILAVAMLLLSACSVSKYNESSVVKGDFGQLRLVGDPSGRIVLLEGQQIKLDNEKTVNLFELKSGTYNLEIRRNGTIQLTQKVFITTSQTTEVKIP